MSGQQSLRKSWQRFTAMVYARNMEFLRDRSALVWSLVFPFFLLFGFSFMFSRDKVPESYKIGVTGPQAAAWLNRIEALPQVQAVGFDDAAEALDKLQHHRLDLLLDTGPVPPVYHVSETAPKSYQAEQLVIRVLEREARPPPAQFARRSLRGSEVPYLDWFFPGMMGMNIMFGALYGVSYVIVRYRRNGVLKRISATPVTAFEYLSAQLVSRMVVLIFTTAVVFLGALLIFRFEVRGSWLALILLFLLGSASMIALGMMAAARTESEELIGGLLNLLSWPMMFLSEVWFSLEGSPVWLQKLALALPLTHLITGAREIMNDGASLTAVADHILILAAMTVLFLGVGASTFRWVKR